MLERAMPLVEQVRQQLLRWIRDDTLVAHNGSLPSEAEIAERLAVSRATVRDALARLERDRVIIRRHGAGTYINPTVKEFTAGIDVLRDPAALIELVGHTASVGRHTAHLGRISARAAQALDVPDESPALDLSVIYLAGGRPAVWLQGIVPVGDPPPPIPKQYSTLAQFIGDLTGQVSTHSIASLEAAVAEARLAKLLKITSGRPLMRLVDVYLDDEGTPAFYSESYFTPGLIPLQVLRKTDGVPRRGRVSIW